MPKRPNTHNERFHLDDLLRKKIRTSLLLKRLDDNALGKLKNEMSHGQVRSAEILLAKVMPNLATLEITGDVNVQHIVSARPMELEQWAKKYGDGDGDGDVIEGEAQEIKPLAIAHQGRDVARTRPKATPAAGQPKPDRREYMRAYMAKRRAARKALASASE